MIRLTELLKETTKIITPNPDDVTEYPDWVQKKYEYWERHTKGWGKRYLQTLPPAKTMKRQEELRPKLIDVLKKINGAITKVPPSQMPALHFTLLKKEIAKFGKVSDAQLQKLCWDLNDKFKTVWDEAEYLIKIITKKS